MVEDTYSICDEYCPVNAYQDQTCLNCQWVHKCEIVGDRIRVRDYNEDDYPDELDDDYYF